MDGDIFGPYSAKEMLELDVLPDIKVTEASIDTWQVAGNFDFASLAKQEVLERIKSVPTNDVSGPTFISEQQREQLKVRLNNADNVCPSAIQVAQPHISPNIFPDRIEYKANLNKGLHSIGGKIIITPTQLIFHPHNVNFGDLNDRVFEISQISGYEKGNLTFLYISFLNGTRIKLAVWDKSEIISQLEARRSVLQNKYCK